MWGQLDDRARSWQIAITPVLTDEEKKKAWESIGGIKILIWQQVSDSGIGIDFNSQP